MPTPEAQPPSGKEQKPAGNPPPNRPRPEKGSGGNLIWYVLGVAALVLLVNMYFQQRNPSGDLTYGEFMQGIDSKRFTSENVHKLKIGLGYVTFQSPPDGGSRSASDSKPEPPRKYHIPIVGLSDIDRSSLREL